jgi:ribosomal-protein-alanine N-acetyltransferase
VDAGSAWLGYRLAERVTGRGVASAAVRRALDVAAARLALRVVRARTSLDNLASHVVLERTGFRRRTAGTDERVDLFYERVLR